MGIKSLYVNAVEAIAPRILFEPGELVVEIGERSLEHLAVRRVSGGCKLLQDSLAGQGEALPLLFAGGELSSDRSVAAFRLAAASACCSSIPLLSQPRAMRNIIRVRKLDAVVRIEGY